MSNSIWTDGANAVRKNQDERKVRARSQKRCAVFSLTLRVLHFVLSGCPSAYRNNILPQETVVKSRGQGSATHDCSAYLLKSSLTSMQRKIGVFFSANTVSMKEVGCIAPSLNDPILCFTNHFCMDVFLYEETQIQ